MKEMMKLKEVADQLKGIDSSKFAAMLDNPEFQSVMTNILGGKESKLGQDKINQLKSEPEYTSSPKIKNFVDELEKVGFKAVLSVGKDEEIKQFLLKVVKK